MLELCERFICRYHADDQCNDYVLCGDCMYHDCDSCVYCERVSEFADFCVLQDGCGCGQSFSP